MEDIIKKINDHALINYGKDWVLILHNNGKIEAWRDYDYIWGSPIYEVLGYFTGSHKEALKEAKLLGSV